MVSVSESDLDNKNFFKSKLQELISNEDADITSIKTEKLKLKNFLQNKTYNINLKLPKSDDNTNYQKIENLNSTLLSQKKSHPDKYSFNLKTEELKVGDFLPLKFITLQDKIHKLPSNKFNVLFFLCRNYTPTKQITEKFFRFLHKNKSISSLHINLDNIKSDGLLEYTKDYIQIKRLFQVSSLPYAIIYDSKFRILYKGPTKNLYEEKNFTEIFSGNILQGVDKSKLSSEISEVSEKINKLNFENKPVIEKNEMYLLFKQKMKEFNKIYFKKQNYKLRECEIKISQTKNISSQDGKNVTLFNKPQIDYNENSILKEKTGKFLEDLIFNFKPILTFKAHEQEEDYTKYLKFAIDYINMGICLPMGLQNKIKLSLKCEENLGLCRKSIKYTLLNKNPLSDCLSLENYLNYFNPMIANFSNEASNELKDLINLNFNYFQENNRKFVVPYFDENLEEKAYEPIQGEITIIYSMVYNPALLQMVLGNLPLRENIVLNNNSVKEIPKINTAIGILCSQEEINFIINSPEFIQAKEFSKNLCKFLFIDTNCHLAPWMQFFSIDDANALIFYKSGKRHLLNSDKIISMNDTLREAIYENKKYIIDKYQYNQLRKLGRKFMEEDYGLGYEPKFYFKFKTISDIENMTIDKFEVLAKSYEVSFSLKIRKNDRYILEPYIEKIKNILNLKNEEDLEILEDLYETVEIPLSKIGENENCNKCNKCEFEIKSENSHFYFYCYWCNVYFCEKCGNDYHPEAEDLKYKLPHEHYLILIKNKNQKNLKHQNLAQIIERNKLGHNLWQKYYYPENVLNSFGCTGCDENFPSPNLRHICLSCRPGPIVTAEDNPEKSGFVDYCEKCMQAILKDEIDKEENKKLKNSITKEGHDCHSHIYMRVDYQTGNYYVL
jgi:hypothetical protein